MLKTIHPKILRDSRNKLSSSSKAIKKETFCYDVLRFYTISLHFVSSRNHSTVFTPVTHNSNVNRQQPHEIIKWHDNKRQTVTVKFQIISAALGCSFLTKTSKKLFLNLLHHTQVNSFARIV